jgi:hypothetical protein
MLLTETGSAGWSLDRQKDATSLLASFQRLDAAFELHSFCVGEPSHQKVKRVNRRTKPHAGNVSVRPQPERRTGNIADTQYIPEQTTHGHVQNAMTKLGARTRAQAVAMQSSQLRP